MSILSRIRRPRGITATGALLALALLLACAVAWQALRAARAHRAATERLLRDHAAYAAAEFARRAGATLESGFVSLQHFPTDRVEARPATTPLPSAVDYRAAIHVQDYWCQCFDGTEGFFVLRFDNGALDVAGARLDAGTERWLRDSVTAHAARLARSPADANVNLMGEVEGRTHRTSYQLRVQQTTATFRADGGRAQALLFTVLFDDRDRLRAAYGLVDDPASFAAPVFRRVFDRVRLFPASVAPDAPNAALVRVTVTGPGGRTLYRSAADAAAPGAIAAEEPLPGAFGAMRVRVELRPDAAARLVDGGLPASPLPLLVALLAVTAGVVAVAFLQLRRQHELARLRAQFVSGVSHELRTPLTQIRMFSELLLGGRLRSDAERDRSLRLIDREARRLAYLVENVLDFSRGERGALTVLPEPVEVAAAVDEIVEGFAPVARARGMQLRVELDADAHARLDRGGFRQVLLNFLENAVKYGPAGQTIVVRAARVADAVRVSVEDGGPGIPPKERARIWEPYVRLDREIDRVVGGSGIGLSVVRELVARHGGRAWVEDAPGGGARFTAEFPAMERRTEADSVDVDAAELAEAAR
ncbi:HAMP domain-containing sensor histidine kinase [Longimicrobium sp.]|uniref:sensor histidine kinase n=1 Tax=Longimicrobium sp. TaxID=2029185 RepID=UPI002E36D56B|nr:HAMP domain-containing sensor histidine kinase [Longimicrobium sp.]HEX6039399.1 HAMP domain-containing sensor histidine kinase [Longimicrobium sp.]